MTLTPKENYLRTLRGEIPDFVPSLFHPHMMPIREELLTPSSLPDGKPFVTGLGVTYVGSEELNFGAMPAPNIIIVDDILKWRDRLKIRDVTGRDWEGYYKKEEEKIDRENLCLAVDGGDYFLILVSLMGFENAMFAISEEPEEVIAMLTEISKFLLMVTEKQMQHLRPDVYILMDDDSAYTAPFFSLKTYREIFKPFHKLHIELALKYGCMILRHDCGKSDQFLEDWLEMGVNSWHPFQVTNDCKGIKQKYGDRLTLEGGWDNQGKWNGVDYSDDELIAAMEEYTAIFAPGGRFVFSATAGPFGAGAGPNPKSEVVRKFYEEKVKYYYK
ncbi:MAG: hypothetical protein FWB97_02620 [Oscillospiraceae bacterium]|nr:hypothetical protein [Oscillospiraceae bacterium]